MKTKFLLTGILALFVLSTSTFAQTGKTGKPATTKKGGNKKDATSLKGGSKGTAATTTAPGTGTTLPTNAKPAGGNDGGRNVATQPSTSDKPNLTVPAGDNPFKAVEAAATPVVQEVAGGSVNYTEQYIEAVGKSVIAPVGTELANGKKIISDAQARLMAEQGAKADAQRNLLSIVKGVSVIGETTVEDMITSGDYVYTRVEGIVKGAKIVGQARVKDGTIEVTMRMPLYDTNNGVAAGFAPTGLDNARKAAGLTDIYNGALDLAAGEKAIDGSSPLAFTVAGKKIDPSMFPVVVDENGKVLLDFSKIYQQTGKLPKIVSTTKELMSDLGLNKVADTIGLIEGKVKGTFTLADTAKKGKVNWGKIGEIAGKIGKVLLNILL